MSKENKSLWESLHAAVSDRLSHPVIGALLLSFLAWNWASFVAVLCSDAAAAFRITEAEKYATSTTLLLGPLLTTAIYVLASPVLRWAALRWDLVFQTKSHTKFHEHRMQELDDDRRYQLKLEALRARELQPLEAERARLQTEVDQLARRRDEIDGGLKGLDFFSSQKWRDLRGPLRGSSIEERERAIETLKLHFKQVENAREILKASFGFPV